MKLTSVLHYRHPKYYYYASNFGWGIRKYKENFHKKWKYQIGINRNLPVEDYVTERKLEIPDGYKIENPIDYVKSQMIKYDFKSLPKARPWPFNKKEEYGSTAHEDYNHKRELFFNQKSKLLEGFKGVLNFSNSILESENSLPDEILKNADKLKMDNEILQILDRRLDWSDKFDSNNSRINTDFEFPRLNKWALPKYGPSADRKERNILATYLDCSELLIAKQFGFLYYPKIYSPKFEIAFKREDKKCILDLRCDFLTLLQNPLEDLLIEENNVKIQSDKNKLLNPLFSLNVNETKNKELISIDPIDWQINFDPTHFYPTDEQLNKPAKLNQQNIDTIFLGNNFNLFKPIPDRIMKGKLLLHMYGFAVGRARELYGNPTDYKDDLNYKIIDRPITIKGVFINYSKRNLGFACLQLNTLSFDSDVKNQVWFDSAYDITENREEVLKKLTLMNLNSFPFQC